jgi:hypothetical protein
VLGLKLSQLFFEVGTFILEGVGFSEVPVHFGNHADVVVKACNCELVVVNLSAHLLVLVLEFLETLNLERNWLLEDLLGFEVVVKAVESLHLHQTIYRLLTQLHPFELLVFYSESPYIFVAVVPFVLKDDLAVP